MYDDYIMKTFFKDIPDSEYDTDSLLFWDLSKTKEDMARTILGAIYGGREPFAPISIKHETHPNGYKKRRCFHCVLVRGWMKTKKTNLEKWYGKALYVINSRASARYKQNLQKLVDRLEGTL